MRAVTVVLSLLVGLSAAGVKPSLTPAKFEDSIRLENLLGHTKKLWEFANLPGANGTRSFGSVGNNASADYLAELAAKHGYQVERQPVVYPTSTLISSSLKFNGDDVPQSEISTFLLSAPATNVSASLILVPEQGCDPANYAGLNAAGKIVLVLRGNCSFDQKGRVAKAAGVAGLIIRDNLPGPPISPYLGPDYETNPSALFITQEAAAPIVERLTAGENITATMNVNIVNEIHSSVNVIATSKGGNQNQVLVVGAHLDSVTAGAGINDNGSGIATLAELAIQLSKFSGLRNAVRFAWWTAEEIGLIGSAYYVEHLPATEKAKIYANINIDMVASTNYIVGIYDADNSTGLNEGDPLPDGSRAIEKLYQDHYDQRGINRTDFVLSFSSDHLPFLDAGIPSGGVISGAYGLKTAHEVELFGGKEGVQHDPCYHKSCDTPDNLAGKPFLWNARATADVVGQLLIKDPKDILQDSLRVRNDRDGIQKFDYGAKHGDGGCHPHLEEL